MTELGKYLAAQQRDREGIHADFLTGSLINDYWQINEKVVATFTVGIKQRWVGSAFIVGSIANSQIGTTGSTNYIGEGAMSSWAFIASGGDNQ